MTPFARRLAGLVGLLVVVALVWWGTGGGPDDGGSDAPAATATSAPSGGAPSGLPELPLLDAITIPISELPPEAVDTLGLIEAGGPYPFAKDGSVFANREKLLPLEKRGYYREYTVPTPGSPDRGARRIVVGGQGEAYYSADHYETFQRIQATR